MHGNLWKTSLFLTNLLTRIVNVKHGGSHLRSNVSLYVTKSQQSFDYLPRDLHRLQNFIGSAVAHASPFHQVS